MRLPHLSLRAFFAAGAAVISILIFFYTKYLINILQTTKLSELLGLQYTLSPIFNRFITIRFLFIIFGIIMILRSPVRSISKAIKFFSRNHTIIAIFSFVIYTVFVIDFFSGGRFRSIPVLQDDYAVHYSDAIELAEHLKNGVRLWGYSPYFCSGMISFCVDALWPALFILLFEGILGAAFAFNLSILSSLLVPVLLIWLTSINFGINNQKRTLLLILNMLAITGIPPLFQFYSFGCNGFVLASYIAMYVLSLVYHSTYNTSMWRFFLLILSGLFLAILHPLGALTFILIFIPFPLVYKKQISKKILLWWLSGLLIVLSVSSTWLIPYFTVYPGKDNLIRAYMQTSPTLLFTTLLENKPFSILLFLSAVSGYTIFTKQEQNKNGFSRLKLFITGAFFLSVVAFFGTQAGLADSQPQRFIIPLVIMLTLIISTATRHTHSTKMIRVVSLLALIIIVEPGSQRYIYRSDYPDDLQKIISFLSASNDNRRILIQDSDTHPYTYTHISAWLPHGTSMETTAHPYTGLKPKFTQFRADTLFDQPLDQLRTADLKSYFELYNIGWIIVYSQSARAYFDSIPEIEPLIVSPTANLYGTQVKNSLCYKGSADIDATYNQFIVNNCISDTLILKYHYFKYLKVFPNSVLIDGVYLQNDPVPFIRLINVNGTCTVTF